MGRLKVTPSGKRRKTRPITRIGKKQYNKSRFKAENRAEIAGHNNDMSRDMMFREDETATALQHYTRAGFSVDPSKTVGQSTNAKSERSIIKLRLKKIKRRTLKAHKEAEEEASKKREEEEAYAAAAAAEGKKRTKKPVAPRPMNENDSTMICNLMLKYGTQFRRMALDAKLNPFQHTPAQLQKMCANFVKLEQAMFPEEFEAMRAKGLVEDPEEMLGVERRRRPEGLRQDADDDEE